MTFYKYQGTGNDFILLDDRSEDFPAAEHQHIARLCHRRFGIGADGLILLRNCPDYDFQMLYYNADGHPGSLCGNGGRCTVAFARQLGVIGQKARFMAADGPHEALVEADGTVRLKMSDVAAAEPIAAEAGDVFLDTGSPHYVRFLPPGAGAALAELDVLAEGRALRGSRPHGTNVNFVEAPATASQPWAVRTYERGVEDETYSCGTGVTAVALAAAGRGAASPVRLRTPGGELEVAFEARADGSFANVWLSGPAVLVFQGRL
ncbi:diaminopimelate epimerase [uncultured Hymenobacter sp.]|uniref:diaminopimelate epimerase n=1 Tax=uncultured Hymenobacter sp. TaxID=170016 RepID=UPI0035CBAD70